MKTQGKETLQEIAVKYASFDKLEFAGASMFGVVKNRKTRTLSYEQVFMLDSHIQLSPKSIILKETKVKSRSNQKTSQNIASYTTYSSSNNTSDTVKPKVSETIPINSHVELKKERRMLSLKELLY